ncbi:hypothetical protein PRECH8_07590 [Insulibacter thermoxylanivorax]|uniref:Cell division protein FtsL n=1 Tax=Insulibacter thermoxylanivorax TaxID=2749268 RepID=A0A916VF45_9BACL|nr:septum formation initiator family protein [Insulibacter thermoxylanivorax]GFR37463.1 hypothetical protein PRECH8_07590 [Insulibacter thermoxylanivorax]
MVSYVHGSAALDERSRQQQRVIYREKKKKVYKRSVVTPQEKLLWMFGVIVCVVVAGTILFRYAQIYEINTRIQQMEQEIRRIELENSTLKLEVAKLQDNKRLLEISKELGYVPADSITEISLSSVESDVSIAMSGQE